MLLGFYSSLWYSCFEDAKNINTQGCFNTGPKFAGNGDYHLQSAMGRWENGVWVTDTTMSPCIDAGDPEADALEEPMPNGGRINIGAYGGTFQASKTYFGPAMCLPVTGLTNLILHGFNPPPQTFYVGVTSQWNRDLAYKITTNAPWLSLSPSTGIVANAASPQAILATYVTENLPVGEHIAQVSVSSHDAASGFPATNANQSLAVRMVVAPPPTLSVWPASISVESEEDRNAPAQVFWVSNSSPYFASILTNTSPVSWAGVRPATNRLAPGESCR